MTIPTTAERLAWQHGATATGPANMHIRCEFLGETALLLHVDAGNDTLANVHAHSLATALRRVVPDGVDEVVPALRSVLVRHHRMSSRAAATLRRDIQALARGLADDASARAGRLHQIPVRYGGAHGADLDGVAHAHGLTPHEVIALHTAPEYRVAMIGFAPGFPYLLGLDSRLATPRRETPRTRVAAGSVGIAGEQTGIYPSELPGGWQLLGRTSVRMFDPDNEDQPCLLAPGDRVRFTAVDAEHRDDGTAAC